MTHTEWWDKYGPKGTITVIAEPGERNDIVVHGSRITDTVPLHAGAGCEPDPDGGVRCRSGYEIVVQAGDLDDRVRFEPGGAKNDVYGGEGDDILVSSEFGARFDGGPGNDRMAGGRGHDVLHSGAGRDLLVPGTGVDRPFAGPGNDIVRARDGDVDEVLGAPPG